MKLQNTSQVIATCVAAPLEFHAAPPARSGGSSASEDDGEESGGLHSTAHEWQMVCPSDSQLSLATMPAGYSFTVPSLPEAAPARAFDIVRFVEFVPGDAGIHFLHNVALQMSNANWIFFGEGDTGEWRPGNWTWQKQPVEVITLTYAWKNDIPKKMTSFRRNALGWYVTDMQSRARHSKVLYLLPPTNVAEVEVLHLLMLPCGHVHTMHMT